MLNSASDAAVADVQELSPTVQTLHWVAPSCYLGNKVSQAKWNQIPSTFVFITIVWSKRLFLRVQAVNPGCKMRCGVPSLSQVSSYGGFLTYQLKSFGIPSEGMTLMDRRPDVVLTVRDAATPPFTVSQGQND